MERGKAQLRRQGVPRLTRNRRWLFSFQLPCPLAAELTVAKSALAQLSPSTSIHVDKGEPWPPRSRQPDRPTTGTPPLMPRSLQPPRGEAAPPSRGALPPAPVVAA